MSSIKYDDIKCPSCGEMIISHPDYDYLYGTPIRSCPKCGAEYNDPHFHEIAVDGIRRDPKDKAKFRKDMIILCILTFITFLFNVICLIAESVSFITILIFTACIFGILFKIFDYAVMQKKVVKKQMARQEMESEKRLRDPEYAKKLASYGYKVPEEYLK